MKKYFVEVKSIKRDYIHVTVYVGPAPGYMQALEAKMAREKYFEGLVNGDVIELEGSLKQNIKGYSTDYEFVPELSEIAKVYDEQVTKYESVNQQIRDFAEISKGFDVCGGVYITIAKKINEWLKVLTVPEYDFEKKNYDVIKIKDIKKQVKQLEKLGGELVTKEIKDKEKNGTGVVTNRVYFNTEKILELAGISVELDDLGSVQKMMVKGVDLGPTVGTITYSKIKRSRFYFDIDNGVFTGDTDLEQQLISTIKTKVDEMEMERIKVAEEKKKIKVKKIKQETAETTEVEKPKELKGSKKKAVKAVDVLETKQVTVLQPTNQVPSVFANIQMQQSQPLYRHLMAI